MGRASAASFPRREGAGRLPFTPTLFPLYRLFWTKTLPCGERSRGPWRRSRQGTEASCQKPREGTILEMGLPAPAKPSADTAPADLLTPAS